MAFGEFLYCCVHSLPLFITVMLILGVIFVNGWTDAPNAIATCISTRTMSVRAAIMMAAVCNFLGVLTASVIQARVAYTIFNMVDFSGDSEKALIALCSAMAAIVLWAVGAWAFGIPTSESHALIAGLTGAAVALNGGFSGVNPREWIKVVMGLLLSSILGFMSGFAASRGVERMFSGLTRTQSGKYFGAMQTCAGAAMAFMHGAQDGQKFIGVFMLGVSLAKGGGEGSFAIPIWLMLVCSGVMCAGTAAGGGRIIKSVGIDMVKLEKYQGFAADAAGAVCLFISTALGLPVSTTHTKTTAIIGAGASKRVKSVNWLLARDMIYAWLLTFPGAALLGWITALLFLGGMYEK